MLIVHNADLCKVAPVEVDHILGDFIERGAAHGVATPLLKAGFVNLRVYQQGLPKRRSAVLASRVGATQYLSNLGHRCEAKP